MIKNIFSRYSLMVFDKPKIHLNKKRFVQLQLLSTLWMILSFYLFVYCYNHFPQWAWFITGGLLLLIFIYVLIQFNFTKQVTHSHFPEVNIEEVRKLQKRFDYRLIFLLVPFLMSAFQMFGDIFLMVSYLSTCGFYIVLYKKEDL